MNTQRRFNQLKTELARLESQFQAHNEVPGHPDLCWQEAIQIKIWGCLLGTPCNSPEGLPANIEVDWTAGLSKPKVLKALRLTVRYMEYMVKLDEFFRLHNDLAGSASTTEEKQV